ncbi:Fc.00g016990.m01.CDS01 [Cosmosporella sp. VM-42]
MCREEIIRCGDCYNGVHFHWVTCADFLAKQEAAAAVGDPVPNEENCATCTQSEYRRMKNWECTLQDCYTFNERFELEAIKRHLADVNQRIAEEEERKEKKQKEEEAIRQRESFVSENFKKQPISPISKRSELNPKGDDGE